LGANTLKVGSAHIVINDGNEHIVKFWRNGPASALQIDEIKVETALNSGLFNT